MASQALFSRSHLNISFRSIDLFFVTCLGPFFVIKSEIGTCEQGLYLRRVSAPVSVCICVWVSVLLCSQWTWGSHNAERVDLHLKEDLSCT